MIFSCLCLDNSYSSLSSQLKPHFLGWYFLGPRLSLFPCISSSLLFLTWTTHHGNSLFKACFPQKGVGPYLSFLVLGICRHSLLDEQMDNCLYLGRRAHLKRLRWTSVLFGERTRGVISVVSSVLLGTTFFSSSPSLHAFSYH